MQLTVTLIKPKAASLLRVLGVVFENAIRGNHTTSAWLAECGMLAKEIH